MNLTPTVCGHCGVNLTEAQRRNPLVYCELPRVDAALLEGVDAGDGVAVRKRWLWVCSQPCGESIVRKQDGAA